MLTAKQFAQELGIAYKTLVNLLKANAVPGAAKCATPRGEVWQIPESSLKKVQKPKMGRPKKGK